MKITPTKYSGATSARSIGPTGRIWPNGEFGYVFAPDSRVEEIFAERWESSESAHHLDSSRLLNSHRARRGLKGISKSGARMVRNAAAVMEEYWRGDLSFLTLTLPGVDQEELKGYARDWARITKVFYQRMKRLLERRGLPSFYVGVSEVQPARAARRDEYALHLHVLFVGRMPGGRWKISPGEFRWIWSSVLGGTMCPLSGPQNSVYRGSVENLTAVRRSAEAYLGKYMSKGEKEVGRYCELYGEDCIPTGWYSIHTDLVRMVKSRIITSPDLLRALDGIVRSGATEPFTFIRPIVLETDDGHETIIGWWGRLASRELQDFVELSSMKREELAGCSFDLADDFW